MTQFTREYGSRVRLSRIAAELTQTELGRLLGLTRSSVANVEAGRQTSSAEQAVRIAVVLNVPVQWLLTGDGTVEAPTQAFARRWVASIADHLRDVVTDIDKTLETR